MIITDPSSMFIQFTVALSLFFAARNFYDNSPKTRVKTSKKRKKPIKNLNPHNIQNLHFQSYDIMNFEILENRAKCLLCNDLLVEYYNDMRTCKCGSLSIDGGRDYLKRYYVNFDDYEERSIFKPKKKNYNYKI